MVCDKAREILIEEGNVHTVKSPVTVFFLCSSQCRSVVIFMGSFMI